MDRNAALLIVNNLEPVQFTNAVLIVSYGGRQLPFKSDISHPTISNPNISNFKISDLNISNLKILNLNISNLVIRKLDSLVALISSVL